MSIVCRSLLKKIFFIIIDCFSFFGFTLNIWLVIHFKMNYFSEKLWFSLKNSSSAGRRLSLPLSVRIPVSLNTRFGWCSQDGLPYRWMMMAGVKYTERAISVSYLQDMMPGLRVMNRLWQLICRFFQMNRAMTILLTYKRMIIIRSMIKHAVSVLLASSI